MEKSFDRHGQQLLFNSESTESQKESCKSKEQKKADDRAVISNSFLSSKKLRAITEKQEHQKIPVASIVPNPSQPRWQFEEEGIASLAESILKSGLLQPIVVRKSVTSGDTFELVAGERRWRAHQLLGLDTIQAVVIDVPNALVPFVALTENLKRENLSDYEVAQAIRVLDKTYKYRSALAEDLGIARQDLYRYLSFRDLPQFFLDDLAANPSLLSRRSASLVVKLIADHGQPAVEALKTLWPHVVGNSLDQSKLADKARSILNRSAESCDRSTLNLFRGEQRVGKIVLDDACFQMKVERRLIPRESISRLIGMVEDFFKVV